MGNPPPLRPYLAVCQTRSYPVLVRTLYAAALQEQLTETHNQVQKNSRFTAQLMRHHCIYDVRVTDHNQDDQVWLHNPRRRKGLLPKLQSPWEDPYTVAEWVSNVVYHIHRWPHNQLKAVHMDCLWPSHGPGLVYTWSPKEEADNTLSVPGDDSMGQSDQTP